MWRKSADSKPNSSSGALPSPDSSSQHPAAGSPDSSGPSASVSPRLKIKGEISGEGDFFFDGEFEGAVHLADCTFTVGPNARVTAEIEARDIIIRGEVIGSLRARERIHILSTGKLTGDMDSRGIRIEDGAVLHSKVAVPRHAPQPAKPAPASPEAAPQTAATVAALADKDQPLQAPQPEVSPRAKTAAVGAAQPPNPHQP